MYSLIQNYTLHILGINCLHSPNTNDGGLHSCVVVLIQNNAKIIQNDATKPAEVLEIFTDVSESIWHPVPMVIDPQLLEIITVLSSQCL